MGEGRDNQLLISQTKNPFVFYYWQRQPSNSEQNLTEPTHKFMELIFLAADYVYVCAYVFPALSRCYTYVAIQCNEAL